jgi:hypothetical protein
LGREVTKLVDRELGAGVFDVRWNAARQASGTYYYELRAGTFVQSRKLQLLR